MPQLRGEMERYWPRWQGDLSAAWREKLHGVVPRFEAIPLNHQDAALAARTQIVPCRRDGRGPFYALDGIDPSNVSVVVIGNDPYPDPRRATGRSFEQGDLTDWIDDLSVTGRVKPSLLNLACAAAALQPGAACLRLAAPSLLNRREVLRCALRNGTVVLPPPMSIFEIMTGQGVLWINRTPTISALDTGTHRFKQQRRWHRALWRRVTLAILSCLVDEARTRPIVFALFGWQAKGLRGQIKARRLRRGVASANIRFVESGHPSLPGAFFGTGNPLARVNEQLVSSGLDPIDWCPAVGCSVGETSDRLAATRASRRSITVMDRAVGKYHKTLMHLAAQ